MSRSSVDRWRHDTALYCCQPSHPSLLLTMSAASDDDFWAYADSAGSAAGIASDSARFGAKNSMNTRVSVGLRFPGKASKAGCSLGRKFSQLPATSQATQGAAFINTCLASS